MLYARFKDVKLENFTKTPTMSMPIFCKLFIYLSSRNLFQSFDFTQLDNQKFDNICLAFRKDKRELIKLVYLNATSNDLSIILKGILKTSKYHQTEVLYFSHELILGYISFRFEDLTVSFSSHKDNDTKIFKLSTIYPQIFIFHLKVDYCRFQGQKSQKQFFKI